MSSDIRCVHVRTSDDPDPFCDAWDKDIVAPLEGGGTLHSQAGHAQVALPLHPHSDRRLCAEVERESESCKVCVLVPELVVRHWWDGMLHNRRSDLLKVMLLMRGNRRIMVINIPWYLEKG